MGSEDVEEEFEQELTEETDELRTAPDPFQESLGR